MQSQSSTAIVDGGKKIQSPPRLLTLWNEAIHFHWKSYSRYPKTDQDIAAVEDFVKQSLTNLGQLNPDEQRELGQLCYKLAIYYTHIKKAPDVALENLSLAEKVIEGPEAIWVQIHKVLAYRGQLVVSIAEQSEVDISRCYEEANRACENVKKMMGDNPDIRLIKFMNCVKELVDNHYVLRKCERKPLPGTILYDVLSASIWTSFAGMLCSRPTEPEKGLAEFKKAYEYWVYEAPSPEAMDFYLSYAACVEKLKPKNTAIIVDCYEKAHLIAIQIYGPDELVTQAIKSDHLRFVKKALDAFLLAIIDHEKVKGLSLVDREKLIEAFFVLLLGGFISASGDSIRQRVQAADESLQPFNVFMGKKEKGEGSYSNGSDKYFVFSSPYTQSHCSSALVHKMRITPSANPELKKNMGVRFQEREDIQENEDIKKALDAVLQLMITLMCKVPSYVRVKFVETFCALLSKCLMLEKFYGQHVSADKARLKSFNVLMDTDYEGGGAYRNRLKDGCCVHPDSAALGEGLRTQGGLTAVSHFRPASPVEVHRALPAPAQAASGAGGVMPAKAGIQRVAAK